MTILFDLREVTSDNDFIRCLKDPDAFFGIVAEQSGSALELGLSIDLETLNRSGAGFLTCAIVPFSFTHECTFPQLGLEVKVEPGSLLEFSKIDPSTLRWWMTEPSQAARDDLFGKVTRDSRGKCTFDTTGVLSFKDACRMCATYFFLLNAAGYRLAPMGNGDVFDVVKLEESLRVTGMCNVGKDREFWWNFWDIIDLRRLRDDAIIVTGVDVKKLHPRGKDHHACFADALVQAEMAISARQELLKGREAINYLKQLDKEPK